MPIGNVLREFVTFVGFKTDTGELDKVDRKLMKLKKNLGDLGKAATLGLTLPIAAVGAASVIAAAKFEQLDIAFGVMLGSAEKGSALLQDLFEFAAKTPFQIENIGPVGKQMLAMGSTAEGLLDDLKILGDIAAGVGVPLQRLALNFGQVRTQGKLTGRELRDFSVLGVPLIDELSKSLGVSKSEVKDLVSAGKIGFEDVRKVFVRMTSEGGKFANLMDKMSGTLGGLFSNFLDNIFIARIRIGRVIVETLKLNKVVALLNVVMDKWITGFTNLSKGTQRFIIIFVGLVAMIGPAALAMKGLIAVMLLLKISFFGVILPLLLFISVLALLIDDFLVWKSGGDSAIGALLGGFETFAARMKRVFGGLSDLISGLWEGDYDKAVDGAIQFGESLLVVFDDIFDRLVEKFKVQPDRWLKGLGKFLNFFTIGGIAGPAIARPALGFAGAAARRVARRFGPTEEEAQANLARFAASGAGDIGGTSPNLINITVNVEGSNLIPEDVGEAVARSFRGVVRSNPKTEIIE